MCEKFIKLHSVAAAYNWSLIDVKSLNSKLCVDFSFSDYLSVGSLYQKHYITKVTSYICWFSPLTFCNLEQVPQLMALV